ncbi:MAG: hypothetical protein Q7S33_01925 [Nanoarchaeota archaeon]|nr:hypothetical protein [Nanoarchaeota archaeon]
MIVKKEELDVTEKIRKTKKIILIFFIALIGLLIVAWIWASFFYYTPCIDDGCFNENLGNCHNAKYTKYSNMTLLYTIQGKQNNNCLVSVKLIEGDLSNQDSLALENKEMLCEIPYGMIIAPEANIDNCHGLLKEGLQDLILSRLHSYIVQNLGKINSETLFKT